MLNRLKTLSPTEQEAVATSALAIADQYRYVGIVGALVLAMDERETSTKGGN